MIGYCDKSHLIKDFKTFMGYTQRNIFLFVILIRNIFLYSILFYQWRTETKVIDYEDIDLWCRSNRVVRMAGNWQRPDTMLRYLSGRNRNS